jgi:benzoate-CoA ligase family protein
VVEERWNASLILDRNLALGRGGKIALRTPAGSFTYAQLAARVDQAGNLLEALGVEREQRVLLVLDDTIAFPAFFLGAMRIGAVPVSVNPLDKRENFAHYLRDSGARICIAEASLRETLTEVGAARVFDTDELNGLLDAQSSELEAADTHRDDPAFWLYSSGSTGLPKAVVHLHHDMAITYETYARNVLAITEDDVCYSTTKLFHAYGLGNALTFPLTAGATAVLVAGRSNPATALETVERFRPTLFFSVPALYRGMLAEPAADLSSVRLCISAAEALPSSTSERWSERYGVEIADGIGSTEMLHIYCSNRPGDIRPGTSGKPVPGYELRIEDNGELLVRGDSCAAYYWHQHEKTKRCMRGDWFATGDRYHVTEDGYYVYEGRLDDMFKVGGLWVSPADVEDCLMRHPAVSEAAVVGVAVDDASRMKAFVITSQGAAATDQLADELRQWCKGHLRRYEYPHHVEFVDDLPRTVTGKVQRFKLREAMPARDRVGLEAAGLAPNQSGPAA